MITGPTASGKTDVSVNVAERLGGEIVSADSMQIYKGLDVTTAKPDSHALSAVPHHLIGIIEQKDSFSVRDYVTRAAETIQDINRRGRLPVITGGTGLYIDTLVSGIKFSEIAADYDYRSSLEQRDGGELLTELAKTDPEYAAVMHPNNKKRIIRAMEVYRQSGMTMSEHIKASKPEDTPYDLCPICIEYDDRDRLYQRINTRVDMMIASGMLDEVERALQGEMSHSFRQAIGLKELEGYFAGEKDLNSCIEEIKKNTRNYAKRQLTWFRRNKDMTRIYADRCRGIEEIANKVVDLALSVTPSPSCPLRHAKA